MSTEPKTVAKLKPDVKAWWLTELRRDDLEQGVGYLCQLTPTGVYQFCCWGLVMELYQHHNPDNRMIERFRYPDHDFTHKSV